jgi:transposase
MGERTLRRLLIIGSSAVVLQASRRGAPKGSWLEGMLARKPRMLVTVALANKTARIVWAVLTKREDYRAPVSVEGEYGKTVGETGPEEPGLSTVP